MRILVAAAVAAVAIFAGGISADTSPQLTGVDVNPWSSIVADAKAKVPPTWTVPEITYPDGSTGTNVPVWQSLDALLVMVAVEAFVAGDGSEALGDLNGDGVVDVSDLIILLANWGEASPEMTAALMEAMGPATRPGDSAEKARPNRPDPCAELIADAYERGFQAGIDSLFQEPEPRLRLSLNTDLPAELAGTPKLLNLTSRWVHNGPDDRYGVASPETIAEAIERFGIEDGDWLMLNTEHYTQSPTWLGEKAIASWNAQIAAWRKALPNSKFAIFGPPSVYHRHETAGRVRMYQQPDTMKLLSTLDVDFLACQWYWDTTTIEPHVAGGIEYMQAAEAIGKPLVMVMAPVTVPHEPEWIKPAALAQGVSLVMQRGHDVALWYSAIRDEESLERITTALAAMQLAVDQADSVDAEVRD